GRSDAPGPYSADTTAHSAQSPTPYEAFSTLHPVTTRPSSTSAAAPTGNPEYGQYARVMASRAASRRPAQSISIGPILLRDDPPAPGTRLVFPGGDAPVPPGTRSYRASPRLYRSPFAAGMRSRWLASARTSRVVRCGVKDTSSPGTMSLIRNQANSPTAATSARTEPR